MCAPVSMQDNVKKPQHLIQVQTGSELFQGLVELVKFSFLDKSYDWANWHIGAVYSIKNNGLSASYLDKCRSMQLASSSQDPDDPEVLLFNCYRSSDPIPVIAVCGLVTRNSNFNFLGCSSKGVILCKHADVQLKAALNTGKRRCWLVMFKVHLGKVHLLFPYANERVQPQAGYNSHASILSPSPDMPLENQVIHSQVFIYDEFPHSSRPRQCLPYAVFEFINTTPIFPQLSVPNMLQHSSQSCSTAQTAIPSLSSTSSLSAGPSTSNNFLSNPFNLHSQTKNVTRFQITGSHFSALRRTQNVTKTASQLLPSSVAVSHAGVMQQPQKLSLLRSVLVPTSSAAPSPILHIVQPSENFLCENQHVAQPSFDSHTSQGFRTSESTSSSAGISDSSHGFTDAEMPSPIVIQPDGVDDDGGGEETGFPSSSATDNPDSLSDMIRENQVALADTAAALASSKQQSEGTVKYEVRCLDNRGPSVITGEIIIVDSDSDDEASDNIADLTKSLGISVVEGGIDVNMQNCNPYTSSRVGPTEVEPDHDCAVTSNTQEVCGDESGLSDKNSLLDPSSEEQDNGHAVSRSSGSLESTTAAADSVEIATEHIDEDDGCLPDIETPTNSPFIRDSDDTQTVSHSSLINNQNHYGHNELSTTSDEPLNLLPSPEKSAASESSGIQNSCSQEPCHEAETTTSVSEHPTNSTLDMAPVTEETEESDSPIKLCSRSQCPNSPEIYFVDNGNSGSSSNQLLDNAEQQSNSEVQCFTCTNEDLISCTSAEKMLPSENTVVSIELLESTPCSSEEPAAAVDAASDAAETSELITAEDNKQKPYRDGSHDSDSNSISYAASISKDSCTIIQTADYVGSHNVQQNNVLCDPVPDEDAGLRTHSDPDVHLREHLLAPNGASESLTDACLQTSNNSASHSGVEDEAKKASNSASHSEVENEAMEANNSASHSEVEDEAKKANNSASHSGVEDEAKKASNSASHSEVENEAMEANNSASHSEVEDEAKKANNSASYSEVEDEAMEANNSASHSGDEDEAKKANNPESHSEVEDESKKANNSASHSEVEDEAKKTNNSASCSEVEDEAKKANNSASHSEVENEAKKANNSASHSGVEDEAKKANNSASCSEVEDEAKKANNSASHSEVENEAKKANNSASHSGVEDEAMETNNYASNSEVEDEAKKANNSASHSGVEDEAKKANNSASHSEVEDEAKKANISASHIGVEDEAKKANNTASHSSVEDEATKDVPCSQPTFDRHGDIVETTNINSDIPEIFPKIRPEDLPKRKNSKEVMTKLSRPTTSCMAGAVGNKSKKKILKKNTYTEVKEIPTFILYKNGSVKVTVDKRHSDECDAKIVKETGTRNSKKLVKAVSTLFPQVSVHSVSRPVAPKLKRLYKRKSTKWKSLRREPKSKPADCDPLTESSSFPHAETPTQESDLHDDMSCVSFNDTLTSSPYCPDYCSDNHLGLKIAFVESISSIDGEEMDDNFSQADVDTLLPIKEESSSVDSVEVAEEFENYIDLSSVTNQQLHNASFRDIVPEPVECADGLSVVDNFENDASVNGISPVSVEHTDDLSVANNFENDCRLQVLDVHLESDEEVDVVSLENPDKSVPLPVSKAKCKPKSVGRARKRSLWKKGFVSTKKRCRKKSCESSEKDKVKDVNEYGQHQMADQHFEQLEKNKTDDPSRTTTGYTANIDETLVCEDSNINFTCKQSELGPLPPLISKKKPKLKRKRLSEVEVLEHSFEFRERDYVLPGSKRLRSHRSSPAADQQEIQAKISKGFKDKEELSVKIPKLQSTDKDSNKSSQSPGSNKVQNSLMDKEPTVENATHSETSNNELVVTQDCESSLQQNPSGVQELGKDEQEVGSAGKNDESVADEIETAQMKDNSADIQDNRPDLEKEQNDTNVQRVGDTSSESVLSKCALKKPIVVLPDVIKEYSRLGKKLPPVVRESDLCNGNKNLPKSSNSVAEDTGIPACNSSNEDITEKDSCHLDKMQINEVEADSSSDFEDLDMEELQKLKDSVLCELDHLLDGDSGDDIQIKIQGSERSVVPNTSGGVASSTGLLQPVSGVVTEAEFSLRKEEVSTDANYINATSPSERSCDESAVTPIDAKEMESAEEHNDTDKRASKDSVLPEEDATCDEMKKTVRKLSLDAYFKRKPKAASEAKNMKTFNLIENAMKQKSLFDGFSSQNITSSQNDPSQWLPRLKEMARRCSTKCSENDLTSAYKLLVTGEGNESLKQAVDSNSLLSTLSSSSSSSSSSSTTTSDLKSSSLLSATTVTTSASNMSSLSLSTKTATAINYSSSSSPATSTTTALRSSPSSSSSKALNFDVEHLSIDDEHAKKLKEALSTLDLLGSTSNAANDKNKELEVSKNRKSSESSSKSPLSNLYCESKKTFESSYQRKRAFSTEFVPQKDQSRHSSCNDAPIPSLMDLNLSHPPSQSTPKSPVCTYWRSLSNNDTSGHSNENEPSIFPLKGSKSSQPLPKKQSHDEDWTSDDINASCYLKFDASPLSSKHQRHPQASPRGSFSPKDTGGQSLPVWSNPKSSTPQTIRSPGFSPKGKEIPCMSPWKDVNHPFLGHSPQGETSSSYKLTSIDIQSQKDLVHLRKMARVCQHAKLDPRLSCVLKGRQENHEGNGSEQKGSGFAAYFSNIASAAVKTSRTEDKMNHDNDDSICASKESTSERNAKVKKKVCSETLDRKKIVEGPEDSVLSLVQRCNRMSHKKQRVLQFKGKVALKAVIQAFTRQKVFVDPIANIPCDTWDEVIRAKKVDPLILDELNIEKTKANYAHQKKTCKEAIKTAKEELSSMAPNTECHKQLTKHLAELNAISNMWTVKIEILHMNFVKLRAYHKSLMVETLPNEFRLDEEVGKLVSVEGALFFICHQLNLPACRILLGMKHRVEVLRSSLNEASDEKFKIFLRNQLGILHKDRLAKISELGVSNSDARDKIVNDMWNKLSWYRSVAKQLVLADCKASERKELLTYIESRVSFLENARSHLLKAWMSDSGTWFITEEPDDKSKKSERAKSQKSADEKVCALLPGKAVAATKDKSFIIPKKNKNGKAPSGITEKSKQCNKVQMKSNNVSDSKSTISSKDESRDNNNHSHKKTNNRSSKGDSNTRVKAQATDKRRESLSKQSDEDKLLTRRSYGDKSSSLKDNRSSRKNTGDGKLEPRKIQSTKTNRKSHSPKENCASSTIKSKETAGVERHKPKNAPTDGNSVGVSKSASNIKKTIQPSTSQPLPCDKGSTCINAQENKVTSSHGHDNKLKVVSTKDTYKPSERNESSSRKDALPQSKMYSCEIGQMLKKIRRGTPDAVASTSSSTENKMKRKDTSFKMTVTKSKTAVSEHFKETEKALEESKSSKKSAVACSTNADSRVAPPLRKPESNKPAQSQSSVDAVTESAAKGRTASSNGTSIDKSQKKGEEEMSEISSPAEKPFDAAEKSGEQIIPGLDLLDKNTSEEFPADDLGEYTVVDEVLTSSFESNDDCEIDRYQHPDVSDSVRNGDSKTNYEDLVERKVVIKTPSKTSHETSSKYKTSNALQSFPCEDSPDKCDNFTQRKVVIKTPSKTSDGSSSNFIKPSRMKYHGVDCNPSGFNEQDVDLRILLKNKRFRDTDLRHDGDGQSGSSIRFSNNSEDTLSNTSFPSSSFSHFDRKTSWRTNFNQQTSNEPERVARCWNGPEGTHEKRTQNYDTWDTSWQHTDRGRTGYREEYYDNNARDCRRGWQNHYQDSRCEGDHRSQSYRERSPVHRERYEGWEDQRYEGDRGWSQNRDYVSSNRWSRDSYGTADHDYRDNRRYNDDYVDQGRHASGVSLSTVQNTLAGQIQRLRRLQTEQELTKRRLLDYY